MSNGTTVDTIERLPFDAGANGCILLECAPVTILFAITAELSVYLIRLALNYNCSVFCPGGIFIATFSC